MSVFFNIGRSTTPDFVELDSEFVTVKNLKTIISRKIGVKEEDMKIKNVITFLQYAPNEYIKKGSSVSVDITARNLVDEPLKFHQIISNEHLSALMTDCRFYVIKSSNEDNIQKARDCSVWATTFLNQDKFKNAFQCYKHVFFFFGTNRSFQLKGLARMEGQPEKIPDKSIWSGVSNIRLGGNFKIRWIRKKPLSLSTIEKKVGSEAREQMAKATDGYQPDLQIAKKVALIFQLPSQPYYKLEDLSQGKKDKNDLKMNMNFLGRGNDLFASQMASIMMKNLQESVHIDQLGFYEQGTQPILIKPLLAAENQEIQDSPSKKGSRKDKKAKKSKKSSKKHKKHRKRYSSSSSSSRSRSRSSSSSSSSSSYSSQRDRRRQRNKGTQNFS